MNRREFLAASAAAGLLRAQRGERPMDPATLPAAIKNLKPMTGGIQPITAEERAARVEKARRLMRENRLDAILMETGTSMFYFTGARDNAVLVLPAAGEPAWVVSEGQTTHAAGDVRRYTEADGPDKVLAQVLRDRHATGRIGVEERVRFATYDGLRQAARRLNLPARMR